MANKKTKDKSDSIFNQVVTTLLDRCTVDTCVRSVYDRDVDYQIHEVVDNSSGDGVKWYLAMTSEGNIIGLGIIYKQVVEQAESFIDYILDSEDESYDDDEFDESEEMAFDDSEPDDDVSIN